MTPAELSAIVDEAFVAAAEYAATTASPIDDILVRVARIAKPFIVSFLVKWLGTKGLVQQP